MEGWQGKDGVLAAIVEEQSARCMEAYAADPNRVKEDYRNERRTAESGYAVKQLHELVQNAADAMTGQPGRIEVVLTDDVLYVANEGAPFDRAGVEAVMAAHLSSKGEEEIGRYGLGFKSVVVVSDSPQIFSRSGSFGFDLSWSKQEVARVVPDAEGYPLLRLARPLNPEAHAAADPQLAQLMDWATTVVKVPLSRDRVRLADDLMTFPARFLIFSTHIEKLTLADTESGRRVEHKLAVVSPKEVTLETGGERQRWAVAKRIATLTRAQMEDIGAMKKGEAVVVQVATPIDRRQSFAIGQFWSYFPTLDETTLSAIVNAPWKLSPDRTHLQPGAYNEELLESVVPLLVADLVPVVGKSGSPADVLDMYPGRYAKVETRNWADDIVNRAVSDRLAVVPSLPDGDGVLRVPSTLRIPPAIINEKDNPEASQAWSRRHPRPQGWLHPDAWTRTRRPKAMRLAGQRADASLREWLEALVADGTVEGSAIALETFDHLKQARSEAKDARILLDEDGAKVAVRPGTIFLRTTGAPSDHAFVHPGLAELPETVRILKELGIRELDKAGELRAALAGGDANRLNWDRVWGLARGCAPEVAHEILVAELPSPLRMSLRVRSVAGAFVPVARVLLPGNILDRSLAASDGKFMVDLAYHTNDQELLIRLGALAAPRLEDPPHPEPWLDAFLERIRDRYASQLGKPGLNREKIAVEMPKVPFPIQMFRELSVPARVAMTRHLLGLVDGSTWSVHHPDFGAIPADNPVAEMVRAHGVLETTIGPFPVRWSLASGGDADREVMPVADVPDSCGWLNLERDRHELTAEAWEAMFMRAREWEVARRERLYAWAAESRVDPPPKLLVRFGSKISEVPAPDVAVVIDDEDVRSLLEQQFAVLQVQEEVDRENLVDVWGLEDGRQLLDQIFTYQPAGAPEPISDAFPALARIRPEVHGWNLQRCTSMALEVLTHAGMRSRRILRRAEERTVFTVATDLADILRAISSSVLMPEELTEEQVTAILSAKRNEDTQARIDAVRAVDSVEEKLVQLFGDELLRKHVPELALQYIEGGSAEPVSGADLGRVFLAVHGVSALKALKSHLADFDPPSQWVGGARARQFVSMFGFPPEFAGTPNTGRDQMFLVPGPTTLPPAHDYQAVTIGNIRRLLAGHGPARGMVGLPTGAGKTRVAVEAIVGHMHESADPMLVLWIAQTDELCEQAVQTWTYIWRAIGPDRELSVGRLWGGNVVDESPGMALVVATPATLRHCVNKSQYEWLQSADLVVTDEAHHAIAPEYTQVFGWLGRDFRNVDDHQRPMIGLSATPFRGSNDKEGLALARRYASNRLDAGAFGDVPAHEFLQSAGVLAQVSHRVLSGVNVKMSEEEKSYTRNYNTLHPEVEARLGEDVERNRQIIESIESLPNDWTAILFAASVSHAQVLASLLTYRGVSAVAISGETDRAVRRNVIEEFKAGRVRVITNYGVLAQGFDAPAVQAVYITRPTFSPNLYQQMIGRGLRGPANGGSDSVLIVNVEDNFEQFGDQLAFHEFDYLWDGR